jgi:hypothetical protein
LVAGSDSGGRRTAAIASLIATTLLNGLDPEAWLRHVLERRAPRQTRRTTAAVELRRRDRHTTRHPHGSLINVANAQIRGRHRTVTLGPRATRQHENSIWAPVFKTTCPDFGNDA